MLLAAGFFTMNREQAQAAPGEVVMLSTTAHAEGQMIAGFEAVGKTVVLKTPAEWAAMTAGDFASYDAIALADPHCQGSSFLTNEAGGIKAAIDNAAVWTSVVDGNVLLVGTDEVFHQGGRGELLERGGAAFVVAEAGTTGLYLSLSCYYNEVTHETPVTRINGLSSFGTFTMRGVGCFNNIHIVASHPALALVTEPALSNWGCSVHEAFDNWPADFTVLAIAEGIGESYTASDGTVGTPYIIARGKSLVAISDIDLVPLSAGGPLDSTHTLTATVSEDGTPTADTTVTFTVVAGPHAGTTGTDLTDEAGVATFEYTGTIAGIDLIEASFVDSSERTQTSTRVSMEWGVDSTGGSSEPPPPPPFVEPLLTITVANSVTTSGIGEAPAGATYDFVLTCSTELDPDFATSFSLADGDQFQRLVRIASVCSLVETNNNGATSVEGEFGGATVLSDQTFSVTNNFHADEPPAEVLGAEIGIELLSNGPVTAGEQVTFQIDLGVTGLPLPDALLRQTFEGDLLGFVSASMGGVDLACSGAGGAVECELGTVESGVSVLAVFDTLDETEGTINTALAISDLDGEGGDGPIEIGPVGAGVTVGQAAVQTPTPPDTGNAGLAGAARTSDAWAWLALLGLAAGLGLGGRRLVGAARR
jgi:hypothetical protein